MRSYLPCIVASGVLVPLVTVSFIIWVVFYDRAIDTAANSASDYLTRVATDMQNRAQQYIEAGEAFGRILDGDTRVHFPFLFASNSPASVFDQMGLISKLATLGQSMPVHISALRCLGINGRFISVDRSVVDDSLLFELSDNVQQNQTVFQLVGFDRSYEDLPPNSSFATLQAGGYVIAESRQTAYLDRQWLSDAVAAYPLGRYRGWTDVYNITALSSNLTLGISAWTSFPRDGLSPFRGVCVAVTSMQTVHQLLQLSNLGASGVAVLLNSAGSVIVSSSETVYQRRLRNNIVQLHVCDVPEFAGLCSIFKDAANITRALSGAGAASSSDDTSRSTAAVSAWCAPSMAAGWCSTRDTLRPRRLPSGASVTTVALSSDRVALVSPITTDLFKGFFILLGSTRDFENGIRGQRDTAIGLGVALLLIGASAIAVVTYLFTRPLVVMSDVLQRMAAVAASHTHKMEQEGALHALPQEEWRAISRVLVADEAVQPGACCTRSCDEVVTGRLGGRQVKRLHESLVQMVHSLYSLATAAAEQEALRRKYLRYILHEVRVPLNSMALALAQLTPRALPSETATIVEEQCEAVTGLLNDVLTLDKMEQGQFELALSATCIECLVFATCRMFVPTAQSAGVQLRLCMQHLRSVVHGGVVNRSFDQVSSSEYALVTIDRPSVTAVDESSDLSSPALSQAAHLSPPGQLVSHAHRRMQDTVVPELPELDPDQDYSGTHSVHRTESRGLSDGRRSLTTRQIVDFRLVSGLSVDRSASADQRPCCACRLSLDDQRVRQIIRNLLSNSFKFTQRGEVMVELRFDTEHLFISVVDTGLGMSPDALAQLFKPYVQFSNQLQKGQGSGLGLSISKRLAQLHGGDLTCQSTLGKGSSFLLQLPLHFIAPAAELDSKRDLDTVSPLVQPGVPAGGQIARPHSLEMSVLISSSVTGSGIPSSQDHKQRSSAADWAPADLSVTAVCNAESAPQASKSLKPAHSPRAPHRIASDMKYERHRSVLHDAPLPPQSVTTGSQQHSSRRALVVDDTELNVKLLCRLLEKRGWSALPALNGERACALAEAQQYDFDLVIMDRNMPIMNGPDAVQRLRAGGFMGHIVGLTGDVSSDSMQEFLAVGANVVLPKPVDMKKLGPILSQFETPRTPLFSVDAADGLNAAAVATSTSTSVTSTHDRSEVMRMVHRADAERQALLDFATVTTVPCTHPEQPTTRVHAAAVGSHAGHNALLGPSTHQPLVQLSVQATAGSSAASALEFSHLDLPSLDMD